MAKDFLKKSFDLYNDWYFDNRIPANTVVEFGKTARDSDGTFKFATGKITINEKLKGRNNLVLICLLHEMAHARLQHTYIGGTLGDDPHHGMIYQAELVRLFNAGAYDGLL
jgi:hypothetical protein